MKVAFSGFMLGINVSLSVWHITEGQWAGLAINLAGMVCFLLALSIFLQTAVTR